MSLLQRSTGPQLMILWDEEPSYVWETKCTMAPSFKCRFSVPSPHHASPGKLKVEEPLCWGRSLFMVLATRDLLTDLYAMEVITCVCSKFCTHPQGSPQLDRMEHCVVLNVLGSYLRASRKSCLSLCFGVGIVGLCLENRRPD